jgi:anti-sigma factor RsiW
VNADVHALTGAYALHALSDVERAEFERHLAECPACTQEVAELRATATRLGSAAATTPPTGLRDAVFADVRQVRQESPRLDTAPARRHGGRLAVRLTAAAAALLLVASVVLGVLLVRQREATDAAEQRATAMATLLAAEDARVVTRHGDAGTVSVVFSRAQGRLLLLTDGMAPAPSGHDYQAWAIGSAVRSAGLVRPVGGTTTLAVDDLGDAAAIGITVEPAGGSPQPTAEPVVELSLS